jgi:aspartyl-tRNA(Asn)/glutamyl-tRNA(Gln) amidotransferase subunit C
MSLTEENVQKIAKLARIGLPKDRLPYYADQLNRILDLAQSLAAVDTKNILPLVSVSDAVLPWRKDEASNIDLSQEVLRNAPQAAHDCFVVPKVVDIE